MFILFFQSSVVFSPTSFLPSPRLSPVLSSVEFLMSIETTNALVVRAVEFSESSLIVSLFTRDFGKVSALAKGARRLKNPFETSLDLLASNRVSFIRKNRDALDLLTEAKLVRRFRPTRRNLRGLYAGYYLVETLDAATVDYEPIPELWDLADATLARFQTDDDVPRRLAAYEAGLLDALGEFPAGTAYQVYPHESGPIPSLRLFVFQDGLQDRRAMQLLEEKIGHAAVVELSEKLVGPITWTSCPVNDEQFLAVREQINRAIEEHFA